MNLLIILAVIVLGAAVIAYVSDISDDEDDR